MNGNGFPGELFIPSGCWFDIAHKTYNSNPDVFVDLRHVFRNLRGLKFFIKHETKRSSNNFFFIILLSNNFFDFTLFYCLELNTLNQRTNMPFNNIDQISARICPRVEESQDFKEWQPSGTDETTLRQSCTKTDARFKSWFWCTV